MRDYQVDRIKQQVDQLQKEYEQLHHSISRTQRDEQFAIERIKHEFAAKINQMEERREIIQRELLVKKKDIERIERLTLSAQPTSPTSAAFTEKENRLRRLR